MQETRSNYNNLSIYGKVVGKPEYFDGMMAFSLYQEDNNLSMHVVYEKELLLKQGEIVDVRGKLSFDAEDEILILHAQTIIAVERAPKVFTKPIKSDTPVIEEPIKETPVAPPVTENALDVELIVSPDATTLTEDKVLSTVSVEEVKEVAESAPVAAPQTPLVPEPVKEEQTFRLFKVSEDTPPENPTPEIEVEPDSTPITPEPTPVAKEEVEPAPSAEPEAENEGYSLNDFNC